MKGCTYLVVTLILACTSCNQKRGSETAFADREQDSTVMANVRTYIDSLWNRKDTTLLKAISARGFERNLNGIEVARTPREMQAHFHVFFTAFPDLKLSLRDTYIDDGRVFIQWTSEGTNTGVYGEVAPTGKKVKINGMSQLYFDREGKLYREYVYFNELDLLQQLGYTLVPPILE